MDYIEVRINTSREGFDPLTDLLMETGVAGFVMEDPADLEELIQRKHPAYHWDFINDKLLEQREMEPSILFYLETGKDGERLLEEIQQRIKELAGMDQEGRFGKPGILGRLHLQSRQVSDEDWKDNWKEWFKPTAITEKIVIKPSWESYQPKSDLEKIIEIDPGMAFGTGTHPTTKLCIRFLEQYLEPGKDIVLDIGCGSGILSIAAALLGAREVVGIEIDPLAVEVSKENVTANGCQGRVKILQGDLTQGIEDRADLIVANLMADLVLRLSFDAARHLQGKGIYISSGILAEQKNTVVDGLIKTGYEILEILEEEEWCAIAARWRG